MVVYVYHLNEPLCGEQFVARVLSLGCLGREMLLMLGWGLFYLLGLWPDDMRELIQNIAEKKNGFEKKCYPWRSEDALLKVRWYPKRLLEWQEVLLNQIYDYFLETCFKNCHYRIIKTDTKGLQVMCNSLIGTNLKSVFGPNNTGILLPLSKSLHKDLVRMNFDSIYQVTKDNNNTQKFSIL